VATECSWNDGSKTQYYIVILDRLPGRSGGLERAPEWRVRGPLTGRLTLSGSEAGRLKRLRVEKRDISRLHMRTMRRVGLVALDTGKTTVNGTKEARSRSS